MSFFSNLNENITRQVQFGDGSRVQISGKGLILLQCKNGEQKLTNNVYFIPTLCSNILNLGQLTEIGYKIEMLHEYLRVHVEGDHLIMKVLRSKSWLYKIVLQTSKHVSLLASLDDIE